MLAKPIARTLNNCSTSPQSFLRPLHSGFAEAAYRRVHESDVKCQCRRDLPLPELGSKSMRRFERILVPQVLRDDGEQRPDYACHAALALLIIERHAVAKSGPTSQALFDDGSNLDRVQPVVNRPASCIAQEHATVELSPAVCWQGRRVGTWHR